jgi:tetratricopeptide (TPR) repeat protein
MVHTGQAIGVAVDALQQISGVSPGERGRRAAVVALVLRYIGSLATGGEEGTFLGRRAAEVVEGLSGGGERSLLRRLLAFGEARCEGMADLLSEYAAGLEGARRLAEAEVVMALACALQPRQADLALRAGRVARLRGEREQALGLYRRASELDAGDGSVARLAAIGEAVVSPAPEQALSTAIRKAVTGGDAEAAAVGLEERARVRRERGDRRGAARDLAVAAARFADPVDRGRIAHQLADLYVAGDDPHAAREALLFALSSGDASQRDHAKARLHTVSRDLGDQLGMRRWRSFKPPALVSLSSRSGTPVAASAAPRVARWRELAEKAVVAAE